MAEKESIYVKNTFLHFCGAENEFSASRRAYSCPPCLACPGRLAKGKEYDCTQHTQCEQQADAGASSSADTTLPTPSEGAGTMSDETPQFHGLGMDECCPDSEEDISGKLKDPQDAPCQVRHRQKSRPRKKEQRPDRRGLQKEINTQLMEACKSSGQLQDVISNYLSSMNGINLATAFHRLARCKDHRVKGSARDLLAAMMQAAERLGHRELQEGKGLPAKCCSIIAWSCANLGLFNAELFGLVATISARGLRGCEAYEVTNLLWAFAQFRKLRPDHCACIGEEVQQLMSASMEVFQAWQLSEIKAQVLISALVSMSVLPEVSADVFNRISETLAARWHELSPQNKTQVFVALERIKLCKAPLPYRARRRKSKQSN